MHHEMPGHPERPERLRAVMDELTRSGIRADMKEVMTSEISDEDVLRVHPKTYLKHIETH
ncbi:MAG: acetoin utilization deacetylase AcuC-like enzyme [Candidatus Azotimanducaceae bacterium]|jgi:acetoin utilization deacetylase AcuC-like enzyme